MNDDDDDAAEGQGGGGRGVSKTRVLINFNAY